MQSNSNYFIYFAALSVNCIAFGAGSAYSWASPVIPKLNNTSESPLPNQLSTSDVSWIASLVSLGAILGPIWSGICAEKFGRKKTLLIAAVPMIISHLIVAFVNNLNFYFVARVMMGFGVGSVFSVVPNYISDISEDKNRGTLNCLMTVMVTSGILFNYLIGPFVNIQMLSLSNIVPLIVFVVTFSYFVPESPYYYVSINNIKRAEASLMKFRGQTSSEVEKELLNMVNYVKASQSTKASINDLFKSRHLRRALIISNGLMVVQQLSGINIVLGFMETIFVEAKSGIPASVSSIIVGIVQVVTVLVSTPLMDRLGKRILVLTSTLGTLISLTALGLFFYLKYDVSYNVDSLFWLPLASLIGYTILFNLGLSSVPWTVMGELFPSNFKSLASSITTIFCLTMAFFITLSFAPLSATLGMAAIFWVFGGICFLGSIFIYMLVPETSGKSFQEIQEILGGGKE